MNGDGEKGEVVHEAREEEEEAESVISKEGTRNLMQYLDPFMAVNPDVENMVGIMMDDFVQRITEFACTLARHRGENVVSREDIQFAAERLFGVSDDSPLENLRDILSQSKPEYDDSRFS